MSNKAGRKGARFVLSVELRKAIDTDMRLLIIIVNQLRCFCCDVGATYTLSLAWRQWIRRKRWPTL